MINVHHQGKLGRRGLLAGAGAGALVGLAAAGTGVAQAKPKGGGGASVLGKAKSSPVASTIASLPSSGYAYRYLSFFDFTPGDADAVRAYGGQGCYGTEPTILWGSIDIPHGALVRDIEWYGYNVSNRAVPTLARLWAAGEGQLNAVVTDVDFPVGSGIRAVRRIVPSPAHGPYPIGSKLLLGWESYYGSQSQVNGVRVGFSQGGGSTGLLPAPVRVYDSRVTGGKLAAGSTRVITLPAGLAPAGTAAVLANVAVTAPEGSGHLKVWPGAVAEPAASVLNYAAGQTIANGLTVGISAARQIRVSTTKATHVIMDVSGTVG